MVLQNIRPLKITKQWIFKTSERLIYQTDENKNFEAIDLSS
jgi:hypothetical protein